MKKIFFFFIIIVALPILPMSAPAMDPITNAELDGVSAKAGVRIGAESDTVTSIGFDALSWGDPDGIGGATGTGWLVLAAGTRAELDLTIPSGSLLTIDVATVCPGTTFTFGPGGEIAAGITFLTVGLTDAYIDVSLPQTIDIGLGVSSGTISGTLMSVYLDDLQSTQTLPTELYFWVD